MSRYKDLIINYLVPTTERSEICMKLFEKNDMKMCYSNNKQLITIKDIKDVEIKPYFSSILGGILGLYYNISYLNYCLEEFANHNMEPCWFEQNITFSSYTVPNTPHPVGNIAKMPACKFVISNFAEAKHSLDFRSFPDVTWNDLEITQYDNSVSTGINIKIDSGLNYPAGFLICLEDFSEALTTNDFIFNTYQSEL